jgi:hypothetical protein
VYSAGELTELPQRCGELLACGRDELRGVLGVLSDPAPDQRELEREGHEPLLRAVVQVALDAAALGVRRGDDALP